MITTETYLDARRESLISSRRYAAYAQREPQKREHFLGYRKNMQRHMATIRAAVKNSSPQTYHVDSSYGR